MPQIELGGWYNADLSQQVFCCFVVLDLLDTDVYLDQVHCKNGDAKMGLQHKSLIEAAPLEQRVNQYVLNVIASYSYCSCVGIYY